MTVEPDVHILAEGRRIEPVWLSDNRLGFALPANCATISLRSNTFVPAWTSPESDDHRLLGVSVWRLQVDGVDVALDDPSLSEQGWSYAEPQDGAFSHRWTQGEARLPAGARFVIVELAGVGLYWRAPVDALVALAN